MRPIIETRDLVAGYNGVPVIRGVSVAVAAGEVVALLGANGAGKTTVLRAMSGLLEPLSGSIWWDGESTRLPLHARAKQGLGLVTEERCVFMGLTTRENLKVAGASTDGLLNIFPELEARMNVKAGSLSGGEQQMLAVGRALALRPKVLLVDELSLGLAPALVKRLLTGLRRAAQDEGVGVLVVEQHVHRALEVADRAYLLTKGKVVMSGASTDMNAAGEQLMAAYVGVGDSSSSNNDAARDARRRLGRTQS